MGVKRGRGARLSGAGFGVETFERRVLLSVAMNAVPTIGWKFADQTSSRKIAGPFSAQQVMSPGNVNDGGLAPFMPAELRRFYGIDSITVGGIVGDGAGQTIAIIDAYSQPNLLPTTDPNFANPTVPSDLRTFDRIFGLPDPPSFIKMNQTGGSALPTTYDSNWAIEQSLDVEWAHAMAPKANIILVEANSPEDTDLLDAAVNTARNLPNVSVISMSFGGLESADELDDDALFTTPAGHQGITFLASTGDNGVGFTTYPAFSPNVVAVGGTQITTSDELGNYGVETTWNDTYGSTGGGISQYEPRPNYQASVNPNSTFRTVPDVSMDAATTTGVYVCDTSQIDGGGFYEVGGTSLAAPCWGALVAIANQGRAQLGLGSLDGPTQTLPRLYQLSKSDYHDVLVGHNNYHGISGFSASPGYDLTTGIGTPIANVLVADLVGGANVTGKAFQDNNANAVFDSYDQPLANTSVYIDIGNLGYPIASDPTAITDAQGNFTFHDLIGNLNAIVRLTNSPAGYLQVGNSAFSTSYASNSAVTMAYFPTTINDNAANQNYTLQISPTLSSQMQILVNGTLKYYAPSSLANSLTFNLTGTGDGLTIDLINGNPIPAGNVNVDGGVLTVAGTNLADAFFVTSNAVTVNGSTVSYFDTAALHIEPRQGSDLLTISSGTAVLPAQAAGLGILSRSFSNLQINGGKLIVADATNHADRTVLVASSLAISPTGKLDLGGNDMIVRNGSVSILSNLVKTGFASGAWTGNGISSATAKAVGSLTALGIIANNTGGSSAIYNLFDGQNAFASDVLIKYTYYGDADLNGKVDGNDYSIIDGSLGSGLTSWAKGNFDYNSSIDGSDYSLIDHAFHMQAGKL